MISRLLQSIGIKSALSKDWPSLCNEGIIFHRNNTFATLKYDNFYGPNAYFSKKTKVILCNIVVSKSRFYACGWFFKIINIPCTKDNIKIFTITQKNEQVTVSVQAEALGEKFHGNFSIAFSAKNVSDLLMHFDSLKALPQTSVPHAGLGQ